MHWKAALVFKYGVPVPGREAKALENFADAQVFFGKKAADGICSEPEIFHTMYGGGMMIVRGEGLEILYEMMMLEEARMITMRATFTSTDFSWEPYTTGEQLIEGMTMYATVGTELGYL